MSRMKCAQVMSTEMRTEAVINVTRDALLVPDLVKQTALRALYDKIPSTADALEKWVTQRSSQELS